ncbi:hypothetical protein K443DRAFT_14467 [Laccaria amethystina LaAM-08-1]|uniref:Uncharacterized protein n=1 Tax=Laccaria amethystina LaAM-08-1 TaxID=1095629 RepID=A0A0C9WT32_9AGAR|nr:hypothetical protein K443DRAFT_14467 [Laccaria amethystina LaAM-08-1]
MFRCLYAKLCDLLFANQIVVLIAHHVELVLAAANYLVRMLDNRTDTQGPIQDLRAQGILEKFMLNAAVEVGKEELRGAVVVAGDLEVFDGAPKSPLEETKKPRKLVKDENRATEGVVWSIYIRASPSLGVRKEGSGILP